MPLTENSIKALTSKVRIINNIVFSVAEIDEQNMGLKL